MHGGAITDTLGAGLILTGLMLQSGGSLVTLKLLLILVLLLISSPTSTHALSKSAVSHGLRPLEFGDDFAKIEEDPKTRGGDATLYGEPAETDPRASKSRRGSGGESLPDPTLRRLTLPL